MNPELAPNVEHIHVAVTKGAPVRALVSAEAVAGVGLVGDRYARREGFWPADKEESQDLTLIEAEAVESLLEWGFELAPGEALGIVGGPAQNSHQYNSSGNFTITVQDDQTGRPVTLKGIAFDSGYGIQEVQMSVDAGATWRRTDLGGDLGRYSFREWSATWTPSQAGPARMMVRAFNRIGESQGREPLWNPAGYLRNVIEHVDLQVG